MFPMRRIGPNCPQFPLDLHLRIGPLRYGATPGRPRRPASDNGGLKPAPGTTAQVPGQDCSRNRLTLVPAVTRNCHFCAQLAPIIATRRWNLK
jgi:hypothetical protein